MLFSASYQGNAWWIGLGLLSLLILSHVLLNARGRRKAGIPASSEEILAACFFCLGFVGVAIWQVLTHQ
ncbi:MAG: hypothetical protein JWO52_6811 [Gammaproteobacteria bacterium]|jgi:hypothetical protein|nr:hypothetical protein [Gammaproteobacteria bacterium]